MGVTLGGAQPLTTVILETTSVHSTTPVITNPLILPMKPSTATVSKLFHLKNIDFFHYLSISRRLLCEGVS